MATQPPVGRPASPRRQLLAFIARYTPEIARSLRACCRKLRKQVPRGYELVYDNYNALGIGYGPGPKASDVLVSIVGYPRWVTLFFLYGARLQDPESLLRGPGRRVRSIRLASPTDLDRPTIRQLIAQALAPHAAALAACPRTATLVKAVAVKQRPRRPPRPPGVRQDRRRASRAARSARGRRG